MPLISTMGTYSYYFDTCSSTSTAVLGAWDTQSEMLYVDTSGVHLQQDYNGCTLKQIRLQAMGDENIVLDKIQIEWNSELAESRINFVKIGSNFFFQGNGFSGMEIDGDDIVISPENSRNSQMKIFFNSEIESPVNIRFVMEDGSVRETVVSFSINNEGKSLA